MVVTIYTKDDKFTFFDVNEFTVTGAVNIAGTDEVEFGRHGFRFKDNAENKSDHKKEQSADID